MATLVLSAVGQFIGGPIGGAIGSVVGNIIDRDVLFKPKGREGPRLTELQVQTSSYGTPIQRIFGTMRVGGCVIWATDLIESKTKSGGGKGQPSTTTYSYSVSFAVALSGRPIQGVRRIWADGKLLRGAGGDFKSATTFRLHSGSEDQAVDPLIASAEGVGMAPAHRGTAYAVFENFQLADYGNRIPSLTFEVIGDAGPVPVGVIAEALSGGVIEGAGATQALSGFAAYGDSVRSVAETLSVAGGAWFARAAQGLSMRVGTDPERSIADGDIVATGVARGKHGRAMAAVETIPRQVVLAYYDPARDYQTGLQRARRPGPGLREDRVEMAAAIDAGTAKTLAEAVLARAEAGRERRTVTLGWDALGIVPGTRVAIAGAPGVWRVSKWSLEKMVLSLECVRLAAGTLPVAGSAGRVSGAADVDSGTTVLAAFESLPLEETILTAPRVTIVAAGTTPGWRRAALLYSTDDGARWMAAGATATPGTIGQLATLPGAAGTALIDRTGGFEVELLHAGMTLANADNAALQAGANVALVGKELLQFGRAEQLSGTRWRLRELWRGRRGTDYAVGTQAIGDRFALIEAEAIASIDLPLSARGTALRLMASSVGDTSGPVELALTVDGTSVTPLPPAHLIWSEGGDGTAVVRWVRRSRAGWRWFDGIDVPLGEEREAYRIVLQQGDGTSTTIDSDTPGYSVPPARRVGGVTVTVRQIGVNGISPPTQIVIPAWAG